MVGAQPVYVQAHRRVVCIVRPLHGLWRAETSKKQKKKVHVNNVLTLLCEVVCTRMERWGEANHCCRYSDK